MSPESVTGYPRWQGELSRAPRWPTILRNEIVQAYYDKWTGYVFIAFLAVAVLHAAVRTSTNTIDDFVGTLELLDWAALGIVATTAGPAILDDLRRGAPELYLSRSATRFDYVFGKSAAIYVLAFVVVAVPALLFWGSTLILAGTPPPGWGWVWAGILGHAAIWAFMMAGIGLGLSCVMRSARAATLVLFGAIAGLDIILGKILSATTRNTSPQVLSPMAALKEQAPWLFPGAHLPYDFPSWWGLVTLGVIAVVGWSLVVWRHPRLKGVE